MEEYKLAERFQYHAPKIIEMPMHLPAGLRNLGNTCYMNSVLQCLAHTTPLREFFTGKACPDHKMYEEHINRSNTDGMGGALAEVYGDLTEEMCSGTDIVVPEVFKDVIGRYAPRFAGYSQQDAQELLTFLLDGLHEDLNRVQGEKPYVDMTLDEDFVGGDNEVAKELWNKHLIRHDSKMVELFHGQIRYQVECSECHQVRKTFEPMMQLTLPIPTPNAVAFKTVKWVSLSTCLEFFSGEKPEDKCNWLCTKCCKLVRPVKKSEIWKTPPILIMHFKRFNESSVGHKKVNTPVDFPMSLSLAKFSQNKEQQDVQYELYAVINHRGTLHSGHYTAFVKYGGSWYCCDDTRVRPLQTLTEIVSDAAYMLFYREMEKKVVPPSQPSDSVTVKHAVPVVPPSQPSDSVTVKHVASPSRRSRLRFYVIAGVFMFVGVISWFGYLVFVK